MLITARIHVEGLISHSSGSYVYKLITMDTAKVAKSCTILGMSVWSCKLSGHVSRLIMSTSGARALIHIPQFSLRGIKNVTPRSAALLLKS